MFAARLFKRITERKRVFQTCNSSMVPQNCWSPYKRWYELNLKEKQSFIHHFVNNYKTRYPGSKTNVSLKGLASGMDAHNDSPSVFGIFYNDIWRVVSKCGSSENAKTNCKKGNRFNHDSFHRLLIRKQQITDRERVD